MIMSNRTILVVDDEKAIRNLFGQAIRRDGYNVRTAESAEEALELLKGEKIQVISVAICGMSTCKL